MLRIWILSFFVLCAACQKEKAKQPAPQGKVAPVAERGEVVATLQLPKGDNLAALAPVIDKLMPGGAAMVGAQIPLQLAKLSGVDLSAADLSKPVSLIVLNPKKFANPFAVLVSVEDKIKLETAASASDRLIVHRDGLALIGAEDTVKSAESYAFSILATPSKNALAVAYPKELYAIYNGEITKAIADMGELMHSTGSQGESMMMLMQLYQEGLAAVSEQSDRMEVSVESNSNAPSVTFRMYPIAGTTMASFVAAQVPAKHELLGKLPAQGEDAIVFSGQMRAGAARKAIIAFGVTAMKTMYKSEALAKVAAQMGPWFDSFDGKAAMTMTINLDPEKAATSTSMHYLMGSSDAAAMRKGWHAMFDVMAKESEGENRLDLMGMKSKVEIHKKVMVTDGVEVDHYRSTVDLVGMPEEQQALLRLTGAIEQNMYFASFEDYAAMANDSDGTKSIKSMVAAARGKEAGFSPSADLAKALKESKARDESMLIYTNVKAMLPAGAADSVPFQSITMAMGKAGDALTFRMSMGL